MIQISQQAYNNQKGLTLIEVLVAMALLAFISIAIFQATTRSATVNFQLSKESTDYVALTLGLQTLENDISQIYTPVLDQAKVKEGESASAFWSAPVRSDNIRRSRFQGSKEKISFISNGNTNFLEDSPQSDFIKVVWEVERADSGTYSLVRSTDWDAFNLEDNRLEQPVKIPVLENLTSAQFSYYRIENKTWEDKWDSEGQFIKDESRFPDLISIKLEAPDPKNSAVQQKWELKIRPNMALNYRDPAKEKQKKAQEFLE
ncbi:MAG: prepilin-type N-terminal cleavage/methylation domain-containing protein [Oligoflexia bacterium]|nr:prepilin-type N-terminal cleavage/methylation domain-containing protein [Oligoflexia bacterium]